MICMGCKNEMEPLPIVDVSSAVQAFAYKSHSSVPFLFKYRGYVYCKPECISMLHKKTKCLVCRRSASSNVCNACAENFLRQERTHLRNIKDYNWKPVVHEWYGKPEDKTFFGVELEFDKTGSRGNESLAEEANLIPGCYVKRDGSIDGIEVVTHPFSWTFLKENPLFLDDLFKIEGMAPSDNCGMHVHVSRDEISREELFKILLLVNKHSAIFNALSGRSRASSYAEYCSEGSCENYLSGSDKYSAINTSPQKTIEFRLFAGVGTNDDFLFNMEIVRSVLTFSKSYSVEDAKKLKNWFEHIIECKYERILPIAEEGIKCQ